MPSHCESSQLVDANVGWAERIVRAWCIKKGIPREAHDDIVQEGYIGLLKAARAFEPAIGVPFTAYAYSRILGSCRDGMRTMDKISRRDRQKIRAGEFEEPTFLSLDFVIDSHDSPLIERLLVEDTEERAEPGGIWEYVYRLPERLSTVVYMRYAEGKTLDQIAEFFGVTASRVSQLHARAIENLGQMHGIKGNAGDW